MKKPIIIGSISLILFIIIFWILFQDQKDYVDEGQIIQSKETTNYNEKPNRSRDVAVPKSIEKDSYIKPKENKNYNEKQNRSKAVVVPKSIDKDSSFFKILNNPKASLEDRVSAVKALSENRIQGTFEAFADIAENESEDIILRYKVTRGLGTIGDERGVPILSFLLSNANQDKHLRFISALSLGDIGGSDAIESLSEALNDDDKHIRFKTLQGLERTGDDKAIEFIITMLEDPDEQVKANAIYTLGKLGNLSHVLLIKEQLDDAPDNFIKLRCIEALGNIRGAEAVEVLDGYKNHPNKLLSTNAERALDALKD